jgi:Xaa-Pro aminopeptidase
LFRRIIKTEKEINLIKKAAEISDSCIPLIEKSLREEITEKELRRRIERKIRSKGASLSFQTIVACGKRSAQIHSKPRATDKIIKGLGYVDFGASYKGYKSDITVPFIKGKISKKQMKAVRTVLNAYNIALKSIKVGMPCWKLHQNIKNYMRRSGYKMLHPIGHGLGLRIHELPYIGMPSKKKLSKKKRLKWEKLKKIKFEENMVFTIEPAIYIKDSFGFRFENSVLLTRKGPKVLTGSRLIKTN